MSGAALVAEPPGAGQQMLHPGERRRRRQARGANPARQLGCRRAPAQSWARCGSKPQARARCARGARGRAWPPGCAGSRSSPGRRQRRGSPTRRRAGIPTSQGRRARRRRRLGREGGGEMVRWRGCSQNMKAWGMWGLVQARAWAWPPQSCSTKGQPGGRQPAPALTRQGDAGHDGVGHAQRRGVARVSVDRHARAQQAAARRGRGERGRRRLVGGARGRGRSGARRLDHHAVVFVATANIGQRAGAVAALRQALVALQQRGRGRVAGLRRGAAARGGSARAHADQQRARGAGAALAAGVEAERDRADRGRRCLRGRAGRVVG
jgi:hypothetical protein